MVHFLTQTKDHRAGALFGSLASKPRGAVAHNQWNVRQRFDIVDDSRLPEQTRRRRIWRLLPRPRRFAFDHFERRRILTRNVDRRCSVDGDIRCLRFSDRIRHYRKAVVVGLVNVEIRVRGADRSRSKNHSLQNEVGPMLEECPILEAAWFVLARIADNVSRIGRSFCRNTPLSTDRKAGASASANAGYGDFFENVFSRWLIPARFPILVERFRDE
jgi:hypothetical protein